MFRVLIGLAGAGAAALVAVSFLGGLHRSMDTLALFRPALGAVCLISLFWIRPALLKALTGAAAIAALFTTGIHFLPKPDGGDIRIYSKNLWAGNTRTAKLAAEINASGADAVFLQEVSSGNRKILEQLKSRYPHQHLCRFSTWAAIAIASRHPFAGKPRCSTMRAVAAAPIRLNGKRIWLAAVHLPWLWPHGSAANEAAALKTLSSLEGPIAIAGDFNAFPWLNRISALKAATRTQLAGPARATFNLKGIPLPIDFALAPGGGSLQVRPRHGSDHAGIIADLSLSRR